MRSPASRVALRYLSAVNRDLPSRPEFREPFYKLSDGIYAFDAIAKSSRESELIRKVKALQKELNAIQAHLDSKYNWD